MLFRSVGTACRPAHRHPRAVPPAIAAPPAIARTRGRGLAPGTGVARRAHHRPRPRGAALAASHTNRRTPHFPVPSPLRQRPDHPLSATLCKNRQWHQRIPAPIMLRYRNKHRSEPIFSRPSVIFRKVTNGCRCAWGAETYAAFRSVVSTAKANRASVFDTVRCVFAAKLPVEALARVG